MKKIAIMCLSLMLIGSAAARADTHFTENLFITAESLDPGMTQSGVHFTLADHVKNYYPEVRFGVGGLMEVGVRVGATSLNISGSDRERLGLLVGVDLKYQLIKETEGIPVDMAVDLGVNNLIRNDKNISEAAFTTVVSKGFPLTDRGYKFIPYGGLEMTSLNGSLPPANEKATRFYLIGGMEWKLTQKSMVLFELKTGSGMMGGAGIRFEY